MFGVELGEPHRHADVVRRLRAAGRFDRVLGSLHSLPLGDRFSEMPTLFSRYAAEQPEVVGWWMPEGGRTVTFGSDAHDPARLAVRFQQAAAMVGAHGFRPGKDPWDVWSLPG